MRIDRRVIDAAALTALQGLAGNRGVSALVGSRLADLDESPADAGPGQLREYALPVAPMAFHAVIRRDPDPEPGTEMIYEGEAPEVSIAIGGVEDLAEGQSISLPDLVMSEAGADLDGVGGALAYSPTISRSGAVSPFGATRWHIFNMTGISVTRGGGNFQVQATVENPITFNVASGGKTNIASETDGALTAANYRRAASDLTPNMADLNGRPPRTQFWAEDLTVTHEHFHATERESYGRQGVTTAQAWLGTQTAGSVADVNGLLGQVPARVIAVSQAGMPYPAKEERAYGDGAPLYRARADAINAAGATGSYP